MTRADGLRQVKGYLCVTTRRAIQKYRKCAQPGHLAAAGHVLAGLDPTPGLAASLRGAAIQAADLSAVALGVRRSTWPGCSATVTEHSRNQITRDGNLLATLGSDQLNYTDTTVSPSTVYVYRVDAVRGSGGGPTRSRPVLIKTPALPETTDTTPPSSPDIIELEEVDGRIVLVWEDAYDDTDIAGYVIRRDGRVIAIVNSGTRLYADSEVLPSTEYEYTVEAVDAVGHRSRPGRWPRVTSGPFAGAGAADQLPAVDAATACAVDQALEVDAASAEAVDQTLEVDA
jgi:hypothetical protein